MNIHKRRKLVATCKEPENSQRFISDEIYQNYTLNSLPPEVLEMIFRLLPLNDVATSVRLVSRRCCAIAATVLNGAFLMAGTRLDNAMKRIETAMTNKQTDKELLAYSRALNSLGLIKAQYNMLRAVTWRYTHPPKQQKFQRFCFYAGSLLDDLNVLLVQASKHPMTFVDPPNVNLNIMWFINVCKRFMNFFEKVSERKVNRSALVSGCKIVDVLDCLIEGRQVLSFKVLPDRGVRRGTVNMKLKYVMKRAWFTCLQVCDSGDENSWTDKQRFMYLRLRRLVGSVNEHLFENLHYEHELLLQVPSNHLRPPPASTYSGYGEYSGQFFYYGNMNKHAYESKFMDIADLGNAAVDTEEEVQRPPCFDLIIEVDLRCTPELAPLAVRSILKSDEHETFTRKTSGRQELFLKMDVTCPASVANRLPGNFTWELHSAQRVCNS